MRQADPHVVTGLTHRPWSLSRHSDGTPRTPSSWAQFWSELLDVLLDWAHHHLLWDLCGVSAVLVHKDFISLWVAGWGTAVQGDQSGLTTMTLSDTARGCGMRSE